MIEFKRIDHIHICVAPGRLEDARVFYKGVMGLMQIERPGHLFSSAGYWFDIGNIQLHIGVEQPLQRSIRHTAFEVEDVNTARKYLEAHGIGIIEEPAIPGRERFAFIDPFDNRMELLQLI